MENSLTAEEIFEKKGYHKRKFIEEDTLWYTYSNDQSSLGNIIFQNNIKRISISRKDYIDMELLLAINKQCEELGWI